MTLGIPTGHSYGLGLPEGEEGIFRGLGSRYLGRETF